MNYNSALIPLIFLSLAACDDQPVEPGSQNSSKPSNSQTGNTGDTDSDDKPTPSIVIGEACDWSIDFRLRCQDNSVVTCDPLTDRWSATPCGNKICVEDKDGTLAEEAACYKTCDPNNYREQHDCEDPDAIGTSPVGSTYSCRQVGKDKYAVLIATQYCSECNGKECVINETDFGRNADDGDGCNTFLFEPRCANGILFNCEQQTEHPSDSVTWVYGTVIKRSCQQGCQIVPSYDRLKFAICNEDDSNADYYCSVHSDSDFCSIRQCYVDHSTVEAKTVCTWDLYPLDSEYCSAEALEYWHTGYGCQ